MALSRSVSKFAAPKENLVVSPRGQVTLPAAMRKALGLGPSAIVTAEARDGQIVLSPAVVVETETYSSHDIARWLADDRFAVGERARLVRKIGGKRRSTRSARAVDR
ncbi:MAG: AbrB/MazE/SpoVT family DNA-binding domain-containing protein [Rhodospirillaceae bacterium]|nr:AbrB/MazE/SpoVT family DNA-binding domain-containing protein [Rhodospirillaceae bacterium]